MENGQLDILNLILNAGIVVKLVILLLIGFSIYTWAIVLSKILYFKKIVKQRELFLNEYSSVKSIFEYSEDGSKVKSLNNSLLISAIKEIKKVEEVNSQRGDNKISLVQEVVIIERAIINSISDISLQLRRYNSTLASISSIAPFVGLFGTVWGIINSFQGLASGGGSIQAVAPGIAEALVATAIGLAAAIPANWFFNKFNSDAGIAEQNLESFGKDVISLVERSY